MEDGMLQTAFSFIGYRLKHDLFSDTGIFILAENTVLTLQVGSSFSGGSLVE